jgi:hypothetical protein
MTATSGVGTGFSSTQYGRGGLCLVVSSGYDTYSGTAGAPGVVIVKWSD